ncbi:hypothetical protein [Streptomyces sp. LaPpAH-108]|nr:hypothetical protein [Streptomyces sp. LaPpAH-108]
MLEFVGYEPLPPVVTYGPARMSEAEREAGLAAVRGAFAGIGVTAGRL